MLEPSQLRPGLARSLYKEQDRLESTMNFERKCQQHYHTALPGVPEGEATAEDNLSCCLVCGQCVTHAMGEEMEHTAWARRTSV